MAVPYGMGSGGGMGEGGGGIWGNKYNIFTPVAKWILVLLDSILIYYHDVILIKTK